jgi:hypothetical protein
LLVYEFDFGMGDVPAMTVTGARSLGVGPPIRVSVILPAGALGVQAMGSVSPMLYFA